MTQISVPDGGGIRPPGYDEVWRTVNFAVRARHLSNLTDSEDEKFRHVWTGSGKD
jgi:hypothetical protein